MKLVDDWKKILRRAWSIRMAIIAAVFSGAEVALPYLGDAIPSGPLAALSFVAAAGAIISRVVAQPEMHLDD